MFERFTDDARGAVTGARDAATELNHPYIGSEHLLLGLLAAEGSAAQRVLSQHGLTSASVRADLVRLLGAPRQLLSEEDAAALRTVGIDVDAVLARVEETFGPGALRPPPAPRGWGGFRRRLGSRFTQRAKKALELSLREALRLKDKHIGTEHILLGILHEGGGLAATILADACPDGDSLRSQVIAATRKAA